MLIFNFNIIQVVEQELVLDVLYAPEVSLPSLRQFSENEDVVVHCNVSANPPVHAIVWTKQGDKEFKQVNILLLFLGGGVRL